MKRINFLIVMVLMSGLLVGCQGNETPLEVTNSTTIDEGSEKENLTVLCCTIPAGEAYLVDSKLPIEPGLDERGYNYLTQFFRGPYCEADRTADCTTTTEYEGFDLVMKWNDAWLSNASCDFDTYLDRHLGFDSYIGSGAWLTNEISGKYFKDGVMCKWNYYVKIVAVPEKSELVNNTWYTAEGDKIGPVIWKEFAIIEATSDDPCGQIDGVEWTSPDHDELWRKNDT